MSSIVGIGFALLVMATTFDAAAHGPSGGGPDDPEASARLLRFDSDMARFRPLDERPVGWTALFDAHGEFRRPDADPVGSAEAARTRRDQRRPTGASAAIERR